jgi:hypothetical protein
LGASSRPTTRIVSHSMAKTYLSGWNERFATRYEPDW